MLTTPLSAQQASRKPRTDKRSQQGRPGSSFGGESSTGDQSSSTRKRKTEVIVNVFSNMEERRVFWLRSLRNLRTEIALQVKAHFGDLAQPVEALLLKVVGEEFAVLDGLYNSLMMGLMQNPAMARVQQDDEVEIVEGGGSKKKQRTK